MGGFPKALLEFDGEKGIERILRICREAGLGKSIVVLGAHAERIPLEASLCESQVVVNEDWEKGQTSSVQTGVRTLERDSKAFLVWPVDLPLVPEPVVRALVEAVSANPAKSVFVPAHRGRRGHPVFFDRKVELEILALDPESPLHEVLRHDASRVQEVSVESPAILKDFDSPNDLPETAAAPSR